MTVVVLVGVAGCGKSTVGTAAAARLGWRFVDADDHHPESNRIKMRAGVPLDHADREPWLDTLNRLLRASDADVVLACSALTRAYRHRLLAGVRDGLVVHLDVGRDEAHRRVRLRQDHFMPAALVASQFATLERPDASETAVTVDADRTVDDVVADVCQVARTARTAAVAPARSTTGASTASVPRKNRK